MSWSITSKRERRNIKNESAEKEGEGEGGERLPDENRGWFFSPFLNLIDFEFLRNGKMLFRRFSFNART